MLPKLISEPDVGLFTTLGVSVPPSISKSLASKAAGLDEVVTTTSVPTFVIERSIVSRDGNRRNGRVIRNTNKMGFQSYASKNPGVWGWPQGALGSTD